MPIMKKSLAVAGALLCASAFATDYYWQGTSTAPTGGDWNKAANWTLADGTSATNYPHVAGDKAIINGTTVGTVISIAKADVIVLDELRIADGCTVLNFQNGNENGSCTIGTLTVSPGAGFMSWCNGKYSHSSPSNVTIGNRDAILINKAIPGAVAMQKGSDYSSSRSITIDETTNKMAFNPGDNNRNSYICYYNVTNTEDYSFSIGRYNSPYVQFSRGDDVVTILQPQIISEHEPIYIGCADGYQGVIKNENNPIRLWTEKDKTAYFRSKVDASELQNNGWGTLVICDDHSTDTCAYRSQAGKLQLGDSDNATTCYQTCTLGTGNIYIGWAGELDVQQATALNSASSIYMTSYNGRGEKYGKITMNAAGTVSALYLDGVQQAAGTYGASGSGATNIDDTLFAGTAVLTVSGGVTPTPTPVTVKKGIAVYIE